MKTVCKENLCSGCMACKDVCLKDAIYIDTNIEFYNAIIDESKCINCDACIRVCQQNVRKELTAPIQWYQGWSKDYKTRRKSSSGGIAFTIEKNFVKNGGCVYSCIYKNGRFIFQSTEDEGEIINFAGSKYVKSNAEGVYLSIEKDLKVGKKVLFVGLPCQVSALKNVIAEKFQKYLYTIDLICHGTPSPELLNIYLKQYNLSLDLIQDLSFRVKNRFQLYNEYIPVEGTAGICDHYSTAFLNSICYTYNCYYCNYATTSRIGDITLGDSWGSKLNVEQRKKGISLVLCQNEKGAFLLNDKTIYLESVDIETAIMNNHQLREPADIPAKRNYFFRKIKEGKSFNSTILFCFPWICFKQFVKKILLKSKILRGGQ